MLKLLHIFLQKIEKRNKQGPFPEDAILVSFDVVSMFPNIDNQLGIPAITTALNSRERKVSSTECIVEIVEICLKHSNRLNLGWIIVISHRKGVFRVRLRNAIFA